MDVRIAILKEFETAPGSWVKPRDILIVNQVLAQRWVGDGLACYYSDYSESMLDNRETRVVEAPQNAAESTEAPSPEKKGKHKRGKGAESTEAPSEGEAPAEVEETPEAQSEGA